ncbi:hypothetical protein ACFQJD_13670 [Haloplanus sp. GCM10025708]|uniref:hypothetical protein n=1 Tax=Haloferacaceae TaxID=1644056 RepID=UPI003614FAF7
MTLSFTVSDRFVEAAEEWADARMVEFDEAMATKAEQALLEIEHLVSGATEVEFDVDGHRIHHHPSDELRTFLDRQAEESGVDPATLLKFHVDLFARTFLDDDATRPPNAPPN